MVANNARYRIQRREIIYLLHNTIIEAEKKYLAFLLRTEFLEPVSTFCHRMFDAYGGSSMLSSPSKPRVRFLHPSPLETDFRTQLGASLVVGALLGPS
ncbi:hypothetical protein VNO77_44051 [Canavalia gladiata]|uniref:Uncharacterized protein n=1 Tax=Canavalia gladiata TaxID=3824 RepID=A0AAN9JVB7_CANGL